MPSFSFTEVSGAHGLRPAYYNGATWPFTSRIGRSRLIPIFTIFARMPSPTLPLVPPAPRATVILRPIALSPWDSARSSDLKRGDCRDHLQSLRRLPRPSSVSTAMAAIAGTQQTLRASLLRESANLCQLRTEIHPCLS